MHFADGKSLTVVGAVRRGLGVEFVEGLVVIVIVVFVIEEDGRLKRAWRERRYLSRRRCPRAH